MDIAKLEKRPPRKTRLSLWAAARRAARFDVRVAGTAADRASTCHVRHQVYCLEKGFLRPDELTDPFDDRATVVNAWLDGKAVGTLRITDNADGELEVLQMHPELKEKLRPGARLLEVSRLMVVRSARGGLGASAPMFRVVFREMVRRKADGLIISCAPGLIRYYRDLLGFRLLSAAPLEHQRLRGLKDYAMVMDWPDVLTRAQPARLLAWSLVNPFWALRAVFETGLRLARERLRQEPATSRPITGSFARLQGRSA